MSAPPSLGVGMLKKALPTGSWYVTEEGEITDSMQMFAVQPAVKFVCSRTSISITSHKVAVDLRTGQLLSVKEYRKLLKTSGIQTKTFWIVLTLDYKDIGEFRLEVFKCQEKLETCLQGWLVEYRRSDQYKGECDDVSDLDELVELAVKVGNERVNNEVGCGVTEVKEIVIQLQ